MNDIIKIIEKNKSTIIVAIAVLMFIFFGCFSAIDVAGKAQAGGLKVLFQGKGLGFSRFLSGIILIVPILIILNTFVNLKLSGKIKEHFNAICFFAGFMFCILLAIALPSQITLAWGSWLYFIFAICGIAISCIDNINEYIKK